jgi:hypothetical protein
MPAGLKGKQCTIERDCPKEWPFKKGTYLVLTEEETKRCLKKHAKPVRKRTWKDFTIEDSNNDGLAEYSYTNAFLKAVIAPHYGARLLELWNRHNGVNELFGSGFYESKDYVEMGGIEETLNARGRPDELWHAAFKREDCREENVLLYSYTMKRSKGITLQKRFTFYEKLPLLHLAAHFSFKPERRKKKKGKGKKEKRKIQFTHRVSFAVGGVPDFRNLFHVPDESGMHTVRFNRPFYRRAWEEGHPWWEWQHCHFMPDPGFMVLEHEYTGEILMFFFDKRKLEFIWTGDRKGTPRLQFTYREKKLEPKKGTSYHLLSAIAHGFASSKDGILFVSKGKRMGTVTPLSFIFYTPARRKQAILLRSENGESEGRMAKHTFPGIPGTFLSYQAMVPKSTQEVRASIKGKPLEVRLSIEQA